MNWRSDVNMDPDTGPIEAQVGTDKEAGTGALGVLTVLKNKVVINKIIKPCN